VLLWANAALLVHETIHFIDFDTDATPASDAFGDPVGGDTGEKWQYLMFGTWHLPTSEVDFNADWWDTFFIWLRVFLSEPRTRELFSRDYQQRWNEILQMLDLENKRRSRGGARP
jgi:hypothetical protein